MTEEELEKKASVYELKVCGVHANSKLRQAYKDGYADGYDQGKADGYEVGKKNERELQCGKNHLEKLAKENESLKKSALVWHRVRCFDEPDEDGCITADNPSEEGKEYLLKTKHGFAVDTLDCGDTGFFFQDYDWSELEAWAELPEATE